jgi:aspartyl-tRNA(Asn)/glutamyl-tRNA(Gln) amidotransferase subunit C
MAELSREDIKHLSHLARLQLTEEEYSRYAGQLSSVVDYVAQLQAIDTEGIDAKLGVTGMTNKLADDMPRVADDLASINPLDIISNAPLSEGRFIEVRAVLGGEEGAA